MQRLPEVDDDLSIPATTTPRGARPTATPRVMGPCIFDAGDLPSALENLLQDLRDRGLEPQDDAVSIVLDAVYEDAPARFVPGGER